MSTEKKCLICNANAPVLMHDQILGKYIINYYLCPECKCIFTEEPYWLNEAYNDSIVVTDTGIMARNLSICNELMILFNKYFTSKIKVVDYGGGYGILTRMLRDKGIDALWHDKYSKNILARGFEYDGHSKADVMLAFEVLEHLPNPMEVIKEIMDKTDCFIFSTETLKKFDFNSNKEWWYFVPGSGQHIFLSSETTLKKVAELLSCRYDYIKGLHILHRGHNFKKIGVFAKIKILALLLTEKIYQLILRSNKFKAKTWDDHLFMTSVLNDKQKENTSAPN